MASAYVAGSLSRHVAPAVLLIAFGGMMVVAALAMLRPRRGPAATRASFGWLIAQGLIVGSITGFVGAGGGFVIVPALVVLVGLSMPEAVATSLLVIAMNSFVAFGATVGAVTLDPRVVAIVLAGALLGSVVGGAVAKSIPAVRLRRWFGWFVLAMAIVILGVEVSLDHGMTPGTLSRAGGSGHNTGVHHAVSPAVRPGDLDLYVPARG